MPLLVARSLSTYAALVWLPRLIWDSRYLLDVDAYRNPDYPWQPAAALLWCCVASYLSFNVTDGLMLRWMFNYGPRATLVRLLTIDAFNYYITSFLIGTAKRFNLLLPAWIVISLLLTLAYIIQDWLTSNIARQRPPRKPRSKVTTSSAGTSSRQHSEQAVNRRHSQESRTPSHIDNDLRRSDWDHDDNDDDEDDEDEDERSVNLLEVCVFCVVPVGMASFVTMCLSLFFGSCPPPPSSSIT